MALPFLRTRLARVTACLCLAILTGLTQPVHAESIVTFEDAQPDKTFYRAIACGARPGGKCKNAFATWPEEKRDNLTVAIVFTDPSFDAKMHKHIKKNLRSATREINRAKADVKLRMVNDSDPDIRVYLVPLAESAKTKAVQGTPDKSVNGRTFGQHQIARVDVFWSSPSRNSPTGDITRADIVFTSRMERGETKSVALEELTQALGLLTDVDGPYYQMRSIFAENGNYVTKLTGQDVMVLRTHYPAR